MAVRFKKMDCDTWNTLTERDGFEEFRNELNVAGEKGVSVPVTDNALGILSLVTDNTHFIVADDTCPSDQNPREQIEVVFMGFDKVPRRHARFKNA